MALLANKFGSWFGMSSSSKKERRKKRICVEASSLPSEFVIGAVRQGWHLSWKTMMEQLAPSDDCGGYERPPSQFRGGFQQPVEAAQAGRYHLYASPVCPWAHRALIVHSLKGLSPQAVPVSIALPGSSGRWEFDPRVSPDKAHNCRQLIDVYRMSRQGFHGRATVPMLWDSVNKEVINNESSDIINILNSHFNQLAKEPDLDLAPQFLATQIQDWNTIIYNQINNGVYSCGFAQTQVAYDAAIDKLFSALEMIEEHLSTCAFLCTDTFTLADVRLFTTLFRFDAVYHILFKCSRKKVSELPNVYAYMKHIYQMPGVSSTCNLEAIMDGYYRSLFPLNPGGIRPALPNSMKPDALSASHGRGSIPLGNIVGTLAGT